MVSRSLNRAARATTVAAIVTTGALTVSAAMRSTPVHAAGTVTIGVVADLTGSGAAYGISIANGAKLAGTLLDKAGGVNGAQVKVVVDDGATNTSQIINIFQQDAGAKHVLAIVGPTLSQEAFQADHVAQGLSVPVVATSNTAPGIPQIGPYIFRLGLGEAAVVPLAMKTALKHLHFKTAALIYGQDNAFTKSDGTIFAAVAKTLGVKLVDTETFSTGDKDFSTQLTKIKSAKPDVILCGALQQEAVPILVQARQLGITARFIGGNGFNTPVVAQDAGKAAEGAIEGTAWFPNGMSARNQAFIKAYKSAYGKAPDQLAAQAYDAINVIADAAKLAHTTDNRSALRDALTKLKNVPVVTGASGAFSFTADRDAGETGTVQVIHNGTYEEYK
jgi:branched-chain amino acid transport system substrate-binding protein